MKAFDVFNGDADGLCALVQLRLHSDMEAEMVTGVKRDVQLLERVVSAVAGDYVTVLDISLDSNRDAFNQILQQGAYLDYFDHHFAGDVPDHERLTAVIDTSPEVCTSLLVNRHLQGDHRHWAIVGAFGDNLHEAATRLAHECGLTVTEINTLRDMGEALNYNAYGESIEDLRFHPAELFRYLLEARNPFTFASDNSHFITLRQGIMEDLIAARHIQPTVEFSAAVAYILPDTVWARRVSGAFANELARNAPERAHAIIASKSIGGYVASVRAPLAKPVGADDLCRQFKTGGGRSAASGINHLLEAQLATFLDAFRYQFSERRKTC
jgi:hypothetical protein